MTWIAGNGRAALWEGWSGGVVCRMDEWCIGGMEEAEEIGYWVS